jgi:hypothetical protein
LHRQQCRCKLYAANIATAKGFPVGSAMENRAWNLLLRDDATSSIRYARAALLETLVAAPDDSANEQRDNKTCAGTKC